MENRFGVHPDWGTIHDHEKEEFGLWRLHFRMYR